MIYENTYIGTFIYLFGYYAGINKIENPTSFNLTQQTPTDKTVGDLLSRIGGKNFIFEFKRTKNNIKKELDKKQRVSLLNHLFNSKEDFLFSQKIHFIVYPENNDFMIDFYTKIRDINNLSPLNFKSFSSGVFKDSLLIGKSTEKIGGSIDELKKYITLLNRFAPLPKSSGGRHAGIMVNYNKDKNEINFYEYEDILVLKKQLTLELEVIHQKSRKIKKDRNFGMSR
ncbi:hypothetical protein [Polaribacter cellanae]|uniref:Uncharacterized protein n=1 Tax=Polaribacter cellanae TaxID=2818493 RepID=A0A975H7T9_9FLAO|nr:hypothetical protein [Polaribacter cellanae]QTE23324.1 hypothetical protein J3359_03330 [Polaribacter cellanae]